MRGKDGGLVEKTFSVDGGHCGAVVRGELEGPSRGQA